MDILIVEDNNIYSSLIKANIQKHLLFTKCDIISSFEELKGIKKDYDLYIVDYMLTDAKEDEHIDYLVYKNKKVIVITEFEDEYFKKKWNEKIVDFIIKEDIAIMNYLVKLVKRIYKNQFVNVLIMDSSSFMFKYEENILRLLNLKVYKATNEKKILKMIEKEEINFLIIDVEMPLINKEELMKEIRKIKNIEEFPILIVFSSNSEEEAFKLLKLGANDFIKKPFEKDEFVIRINNLLNVYDNLFEYKTSAFIDGLTKTFNRAYLERNLEKLFRTFPKKSIAMIDIDFFKKINDKYGHQLGDEVLKYFVNLIKNNIRKNDILIRYGGEEFLIFMPNTSKNEAYIVLNKLKNILKNDENKILNFTFSGGIADEGETLSEMIKLADDRLYQAKKEGRDKVIK